MGTKIIWSSDALKQLEDIHFYILFESKSILVADKVVDKIFESTDVLKTKPEIYKLDTKKNSNDGSLELTSSMIIWFRTKSLLIVSKFFELDIHQENPKSFNGKPDSHTQNIRKSIFHGQESQQSGV
jgi:plasmid stabilization system protein ParE